MPEESERRASITKALKRVADWTSRGENQGSRKQLETVHITPERIVAADGFTLLAVTPESADKWPLFGAESADVDAAVWRRVLTNESITGIDASEAVQISGDSDVMLRQPKRVNRAGMRDFYKAMPARLTIGEAKAVIFLNPEYLGRVAALAKALKCPSVRIQVGGPEEPVRIDFKDADASVEIGIMPMYNKEVATFSAALKAAKAVTG